MKMTTTAGVALLVAALVAAPGAASAWAQSQTATTIAGDAVRISAGQLADKPNMYVGKRVTVRAEVEEVHGKHAFTLDEDKAGAGPDVLVLAPSGLAAGVDKDMNVSVTGLVRPFVVAELDRDYDWFDLEEEIEVKLKGRPVIVAESIRTDAGVDLLVPDPARATASRTASGTTLSGTAGTSGTAGSVTGATGGATAGATAGVTGTTSTTGTSTADRTGTGTAGPATEPSGTAGIGGTAGVSGTTGVSSTTGAPGTASAAAEARTAGTASTVTLTGCLRRTSDDPTTFALAVGAPMTGKETATATTAPRPRSAMYQLEPGEGVSLSDHVGHQVRITGSLTPARRDAQEVVVQKETVGAQELPSGDTLITDKVTITRYELASAAQLKVTSLDHVSETCDANP